MKKKRVIRVLLITVLVLALLLGGGFAYLYFNGLSGISQTSAPAADQIKIACVGDSITYGHGISNWPQNNYPVVLGNLLGSGYHVQSFGVSGRAVQSNSDQPYTALEHYHNSVAYNADYVVFMMGSNDSKPENWHGEEAFEAELLSLLESYGDANIILCTPAKAFFVGEATGTMTNFDIQPAVVDTIAELVRRVAEEQGYQLLDIHALTTQHSEWFTNDGVHPSSEGAAAIAQAVCNALTQE